MAFYVRGSFVGLRKRGSSRPASVIRRPRGAFDSSRDSAAGARTSLGRKVINSAQRGPAVRAEGDEALKTTISNMGPGFRPPASGVRRRGVAGWMARNRNNIIISTG